MREQDTATDHRTMLCTSLPWPRRLALTLSTIAGLVALVANAAPAVGKRLKIDGFTFFVPAGWLDLSPGARTENFQSVPPAVAAQAKSGRYAAMAIDMQGATDGFAENLNVILMKCPGKISDETIHKVADGLGRSALKSNPSAKLRVLDKSRVTVGGVTCGRLVNELTLNGVIMRQIQYLFPGQPKCALVTYTTTPKGFAEYAAIFDAAARQTLGAHETSALGRIGRASMRGALIGGFFWPRLWSRRLFVAQETSSPPQRRPECVARGGGRHTPGEPTADISLLPRP